MADNEGEKYPAVTKDVILKWRLLLGHRLLLRAENPETPHPVEARLDEVTDRGFVKLQSPLPGAIPWWRHMSKIYVLEVMPKIAPDMGPMPAPAPVGAAQTEPDRPREPAKVIPLHREPQRPPDYSPPDLPAPSEPASAPAAAAPAPAPPAPAVAPVPPKKKGRPKKVSPPPAP